MGHDPPHRPDRGLVSAIRSRGRRGHTVVPNWRWEDLELSDSELRIGGWLASHADGFIEEHVTRNEIARRTGVSPRQVSRCLQLLAEKGVVEVDYGTPRGRLVITFDFPVWETPPGHHAPDTGAPRAGDRGTTPQSTDLHLSMSEEQVEEQTEARDFEIEGFDAFWVIYPRKVDKQRARKAFEAMTKTAAFTDILDGACAWAMFWRDDKTEERFIPHPSTWLRNERWRVATPAPRQGTTSERSMAAIEKLARSGEGKSLTDRMREINP